MRALLLIALFCLLVSGISPAGGYTPVAVKNTIVIHGTPPYVVTVGPVSPTTSATPAVTTNSNSVTVIIESVPSGAEIWSFVYGPDLPLPTGQHTPYTMGDVQSGSAGMKYMLVYPGYQNYTGSIPNLLLPGQTYTLSAVMVPLGAGTPPPTTPAAYNAPANPTGHVPTVIVQDNTQKTGQEGGSAGNAIPSPQSPAPATPGTGSLSVKTDPAGAAVEVDGLPQGASPAVIPGLSAGAHNLTIMKPGYAVLITQVNIVSGQANEYSTTLLPSTVPTQKRSPGFEMALGVLACAGAFLVNRKA